MTPTLVISLWGLAFLVTHLLPTHAPIRGALVARLGQGGYLGVYSLVSFATFVPWARTWWKHRRAGPLLWNLRDVVGLRLGVELLVVLGFALMAAGVLTPAPSSASWRGGALRVRGVLALTRHPLVMGQALWAFGHLVMNGWAGDVAFFGIFVLTCLLGAADQDWRKSLANPTYAAFVAKTSFFPLPPEGGWEAVGGQGWAVMAVGVVVALLLRWIHPYLFG